MPKFSLLFSLSFFIMTSFLEAQNLTVLDLTTGRPIAKAFILDAHKTMGQSTDENGVVDISQYKNGAQLTVSHTAYLDTIIIKNGKGNARVHLLPMVITMPMFEHRAAREKALDVPHRIKTISSQQVKDYQARTAADLLERAGGVFVQRSQFGGGSPILRGFEANRILLVIDGVRMNNAIYRSGHLQNAISVDPFLLEETEILFGPASLIYGSDALGGVIHFHSRKPKLDTAGGSVVHVNAAKRLATATEEDVTHIDIEVAGKKAAWIGSFTRSEYGKMRMGKNRAHGDEDWGLVPEYIETINGRDSIVQNEEPWVIPNSGYAQVDLAQKLLWQPTDSLAIILNGQYSTTTNIPRTDQLTAYRDGQLRFSEWSYGPQERMLASLQVDLIGDDPLYDDAQFIVAYQRLGEDRINRSYQADARSVRQEDVDVFSLNVDLSKRFVKKDLYYGLEAKTDVVESTAYFENVLSDERYIGPTRYPDGGSRVSSYSAYIDLNADPTPSVSYNLGLRYGHTFLRSDYLDTTFYKLPFEEINFSNGALTGSASVSWRPAEQWKIGLAAATGFRSPNVDDYGKVFERAGIVVVPTDELSPEYTVNGELRIDRKSDLGPVDVEFAVFYTHILDAIVQRPSTLNGSDSLLYDGEWAQVAVNENADEAQIYGVSAGLSVRLSNQLKWTTDATYTKGEVVGRDEALAHIPPFFAKSGLVYRKPRFSVGGYALYNAAKLEKDISPSRSDNAAQGINGGFPSWYTVNIHASYALLEQLEIGLNLDNLTDVHFKAYASGVSAVGRNVIFSLRLAL